MKITHILIALWLATSMAFGAASDTKVSQKNAGDTAWVDRIFAPTASSLWGFDGSKLPVSITVSSALDLISSTQGSVLYRNASAWVALTPGTSGQLLSTQGAAANPIWVTATGGAGDVNGPGTSTANAIARYNGTGGTVIKDSAVTIADTTGAMTWATGQAATLTGGSSGASLVLGNTNTGASLGGGGLAVGSSASFVVGATAGVVTNAVGVPQISASSNTYASIGSIAHSNTNGNHGFFVAGKSRGTKASPTILADSDVFGEYAFAAYDGAAYRTTASIQAIISGTPGAGDLPTRLAFFVTPDGSGSTTERMTITPTGNLLGGTTTDMESTSGGATFNGSGAGATSTNSSTGTLRVVGGVGITGAVNADGAIKGASLATGQTPSASVATASTHKVAIVLNGVTYYMLLTNVP